MRVEDKPDRLVLRCVELKHLLEAQVLNDATDEAHRVTVAGDRDIARTMAQPGSELR